MEDYDVRSAASILASVKEQEARFERLTRALEEERRNVSLQLERANLPPDRLAGCNAGGSQPLAWQQMVMQVTEQRPDPPRPPPLPARLIVRGSRRPSERAHSISIVFGSLPRWWCR
ncbi:hypothetical protein MATL_G00061600 [Megalops atlanticus]|uniref:Armadillo repeat protein deleted in velo-cardio-facial syndrome n=1 Tax=Megalops atlanticus TaxID=7932 RepID=A0A9D3TDD6_MEGAT|nr:hypothetical protein MATL_G00061600 [Megalops atlanticus]